MLGGGVEQAAAARLSPYHSVTILQQLAKPEQALPYKLEPLMPIMDHSFHGRALFGGRGPRPLTREAAQAREALPTQLERDDWDQGVVQGRARVTGMPGGLRVELRTPVWPQFHLAVEVRAADIDKSTNLHWRQNGRLLRHELPVLEGARVAEDEALPSTVEAHICRLDDCIVFRDAEQPLVQVRYYAPRGLFTAMSVSKPTAFDEPFLRRVSAPVAPAPPRKILSPVKRPPPAAVLKRPPPVSLTVRLAPLAKRHCV